MEVYKGPSMARPPCRAALRLWPDRVQQYWHWHPFREFLGLKALLGERSTEDRKVPNSVLGQASSMP
jgi:hypothetical protein